MYTYKFMKSVRVISVSAVLSRVPYGYVFLHMGRIPCLHTRLSRVHTEYTCMPKFSYICLQ